MDSASPAIERRSTTRQRQAIEPDAEPEYVQPRSRSRSRQVERFEPEQPRSRSRSAPGTVSRSEEPPEVE
ncbi:MAG: hypothetical protein HC895_21060 [Leptolyngbyaceae cyanobacterium SM1_3_5]|nr:hypothetical protein [Leptolyngbyaceae cyanobacterium SM1_3_5]